MSAHFFLTGTNTEIGKTTVSAALVHAAVRQGLTAAALKPIAAGQELREGRWVNEDVAQLHAVQSAGLTEAEVGPLQLRTPCAPHLAARLEGVTLTREGVLAPLRTVLPRLQFGIVEGVGGFRVPLCPGWDTADLAVDLALPVLLVVGLRLGCINHALLTAEAIAARGLRLAGWVANTVDGQMLQHSENLASLDALLPAPRLGAVPRLESPSPAAVAAHLDTAALQNLMKTP